MKNTSMKVIVAELVTMGLLAGAFALVTPAKAEAQVGVGIQIGGPSYDYARRDYDDHLRYEEARREAFLQQQRYERQQAFLRHEAEERHEAWERQQAYGRYSYDHRGRDWRDRDDHRDWDRDRH